jgi:hypothetical protein
MIAPHPLWLKHGAAVNGHQPQPLADPKANTDQAKLLRIRRIGNSTITVRNQ